MILVPILLAGLAASGFGRNAVNAGLVRPPPEYVRSEAAVADSDTTAARVPRRLRLHTDDEYNLWLNPLAIEPESVPLPTRVEVPDMMGMSEEPQFLDNQNLESNRKKSVFGIRLNGPTRYESLSNVEPIRHNSPIMSDEQYEQTSRRQWDQSVDTYPILRSRKSMSEPQEKPLRSHHRREPEVRQVEEPLEEVASRYGRNYNRRGLEKIGSGKDEQTEQLQRKHFLLSKLLEQIQGNRIAKQGPMEAEKEDVDEILPEEVEDDVQVDPVVTDKDASGPMENTYRRRMEPRQSREELQLEQNHRSIQLHDPNGGSNTYYPQQREIIPTGDPEQPMENTYRKNIESYHAQIGKPSPSSDETYRSFYLLDKLLEKLAEHTSEEQTGTEEHDDLDQAASGKAKQVKASGKGKKVKGSGKAKPVVASAKAEQDEASGIAEQDKASGIAEQDEAPGIAEQVEASGTAEQGEASGIAEQGEASGKAEQGEASGKAEQDAPVQVAESDSQLLRKSYLLRQQQDWSDPNGGQNPYYPQQPDIIPNGDPNQSLENTYRNLEQHSHYLRQDPNPYYPEQPDIIPNGDPDQPLENTYRNLEQHSHYLRQDPNPYYPEQPDIIPNGDPHQPMENTYRKNLSGSGSLRKGRPRRPSGFKKPEPETEDIHEASMQQAPVSRRQASSAGEQQADSRPWEVNDLLNTKTYPTEFDGFVVPAGSGSSEPQMRKGRHRKPQRPAKVRSPKQDLKESQVDESETIPGELVASRRNGEKQDPQQKSGSESSVRRGRPRRPNWPTKNSRPQSYDVNVDLQWDQSEGAMQEPDANAYGDLQSSDAWRHLGEQQPNEPENLDEAHSNSLMRIGRPRRPNRPKKTKPQVNDLEVESPADEDQNGSQLLEPDDAEVMLHMREAVQANDDDSSTASKKDGSKNRLRLQHLNPESDASLEVRSADKATGSESANDHCSAESADSAPKQRLDDEDGPASPESQDETKKSSAKSGVSSTRGTAENEGIPSVITPGNCPCRKSFQAQFPPSWQNIGEDRIPRI